jgi:hypothetical protein
MKVNYSMEWREDADGRIEIEIPCGAKKIWRRVPDEVLKSGEAWDADGMPCNVELPPIQRGGPAGFGKRMASKAPRRK